jgi:hypothetical protein
VPRRESGVRARHAVEGCAVELVDDDLVARRVESRAADRAALERPGLGYFLPFP